MTWAGFAQPLWLWGLAAMVVPIAIHLLSRGRQRRMPVGSVTLLREAATVRARRVRLSRLALLALRCLLVSLPAIGLARPSWEAGPEARALPWLLIEPEVLEARADLERLEPEVFARLDRALAGDAEVRLLTPDLPLWQGGATEVAGAQDLWALLEQAEATAPAPVAFEVVTFDRLEALAGSRPVVDRALEWHSVADPRGNRWIERVGTTQVEEPQVWVGRSEVAGTRFERLAVPADGVVETRRAGGRRLYELADGGAFVGDDRVELAGRLEPVPVTLLAAAERVADADRWKAATEAAAQSLGIDVDVHRGADAPIQGLPGGLVLWLSPAAVPAELIESMTQLPPPAILVSDVLARSQRCSCRAGTGPASGAWVERHGPVDGSTGDIAAAVLDVSVVGSSEWWKFGARFSPEWTDWVERPEFPRWVAGLLARLSQPVPTARTPRSDRRAVPAAGTPLIEARGATRPATSDAAGNAWWALLLLGLVLERFVATGKRP